MNIWESRIKVPDGKIAEYKMQDSDTRHFHLVAEPFTNPTTALHPGA